MKKRNSILGEKGRQASARWESGIFLVRVSGLHREGEIDFHFTNLQKPVSPPLPLFPKTEFFLLYLATQVFERLAMAQLYGWEGGGGG